MDIFGALLSLVYYWFIGGVLVAFSIVGVILIILLLQVLLEVLFPYVRDS